MNTRPSTGVGSAVTGVQVMLYSGNPAGIFIWPQLLSMYTPARHGTVRALAFKHISVADFTAYQQCNNRPPCVTPRLEAASVSSSERVCRVVQNEPWPCPVHRATTCPSRPHPSGSTTRAPDRPDAYITHQRSKETANTTSPLRCARAGSWQS
jgi:hypothetical protein